MWKTCVVILLLTALLSVEGRGGGKGGGSKGGTKGGAKGGAKSSSSKTMVSVSRYRGPVYRTSSSWKTSAGAATLYGVTNYQHRRIYLDNPDQDPTVCFNAAKPRGLTYGYFICPEPGMLDNMVHCCGEEGDQECCSEDGNEWQIAAIIGGIVGGLVVIGAAIWFYRCCCRRRRSRAQKQAAMSGVRYSVCSSNVTPTAPPPPTTTTTDASDNSASATGPVHQYGLAGYTVNQAAGVDTKPECKPTTRPITHIPKTRIETRNTTRVTRTKTRSPPRRIGRRYSPDSCGSCSS